MNSRDYKNCSIQSYVSACSVGLCLENHKRSVKQAFVTSLLSLKSVLGLLVYEAKTSRNGLVKMLENKEMVALEVQIRPSL